jgi:hypothetical protein
MTETYSESYEELKAYIDQQLDANNGSGAEQEAPFSTIQDGVIEKLEQHYSERGFNFNWSEKDNLFVAKISPKSK